MGKKKDKTKRKHIIELNLYDLSSLMKEVGLPGFIVVMVTFVFLIFGTHNQKIEFIDRFILLKDMGQNPFPYVFIIIIQGIIIISISIYFAKMQKMQNQEISRIAKEKSECQEKYLNKKLNSSE